MPLSGMRSSRATINQVAQEAGVSKASVSRYISGDRQLLSDTLALRIEQAISKLGFQPNQMARGLKRGRSRLIGMLVADILNPYSVAVMHGVETACRQHGYSLIVCNTDRDDVQEGRHLAALQSYSVEGLIVNTLGHHPRTLQQLHRELPMVLLDRKLADLDADLVGLNNDQAITLGLDHLIERGYRDLLIVSEPLDGTSSREERVTAFKHYIDRHSDVRGQSCALASDANALLQTVAHFLADTTCGPKAIMAANGIAALAVAQALRHLGQRTFDSVGLIALDDLDWYPLVGDGITAIAQPTHAMGVAALEFLLGRLKGDVSSPRILTLPAELIVRGSTPQRR
ncbi:transcriptional regulator, LacI family [Pseudomonas duriflava]|uniref:Transcriptional regulator, LacI family n=1 Tax=Pseudomonas duriflava TaxID=459528 RepID=A0A562QHK2_9PSED|nr:LacI family DNA-binding transcriptional regulator [Pseudomonas duriflava]TWI55526.1 transcriptional regulator, LacI family [Pseudomonas duriflava]